jgi:hypothetical protein
MAAANNGRLVLKQVILDSPHVLTPGGNVITDFRRSSMTRSGHSFGLPVLKAA